MAENFPNPSKEERWEFVSLFLSFDNEHNTHNLVSCWYLGIDEATLKGYPEVVYGEARRSKNRKLGTTCTCCSVCLDNYGDGDVLRMLPDCGHLFHRECVDPWLRKHPTCPVCRTSPLPSPLPTPLAEVTPLAMTRLSS
ncbi:hypothetical protein VPH35_085848 [Triticum aestivum]